MFLLKKVNVTIFIQQVISFEQYLNNDGVNQNKYEKCHIEIVSLN